MNTYHRLGTLVSIFLLITAVRANDDFGLYLHESTHRGNHIKIENEYLARLDGVKYLVDGPNLKEMIIAQRDLATYMQGKLDLQSKKRVGTYQYQGHNVAVGHLAKIEQQGKLSANEKAELEALIKKIKEDMLTALEPFMAQIAVARQFVVPIVVEWGLKRNRKESFLIRWTEASGSERELFMKEIVTFKELYFFCKDTHTFLGDLIHNCPKGYQQFMELVKQNEKNRSTNHLE